jgi:signal transduction histidine kinase
VLSGLRLRLTALYFLVGLAFLVLVGAGSYGLLRGYYRQTTDLALQHRLVEELHAIGAGIPANLASADAAWYSARGRATPAWPPTTPATSGEAGEHGEDGDGGDGRGEAGGTAGSDPAAEELREHEALEAYDGELAAIFLLRLDADGQPITGAIPSTTEPAADKAAVTQALAVGSDWRSVAGAAGAPIRLLTYALPGAPAGLVLQLGRPLADQERVLGRLIAVQFGLGLMSALLLGAGSWWLAGRSLRPAEAAWRQQQAFVANASHELRTPLTLIRASAEVLARGVPPGDDARALVDDIVSESDHMSQLVGDLLLLSRLDSGELPLRRETVPLDGLATDLARQFGRLAEARGVGFLAEGLSGAVRADPTRLRQVLLALLDNALRHSPAGGTITLAAHREGATVALTVTDTGAGIPPEHLPHVFERFYRAQPSGGETGAGLGLALAKALVEAQHGHIHLANAPGAGTRVTVTLPAA